MRRLSWPILSWDRHRADNSEMLLLFIYCNRHVQKPIWHVSFTIRRVHFKRSSLLLFTQRQMYVANCQLIQWSNTRNLWSSFGPYDHHYICLSQQPLSHSWMVACFIRITLLLPSVSAAHSPLTVFVICSARNAATDCLENEVFHGR